MTDENRCRDVGSRSMNRSQQQSYKHINSILFIMLCVAAVVVTLVVNIAAGRNNYGLEGDEVFSYISSTSMGGFKTICFLEDQTWYDGAYFAHALTATGEERFNIPMVVENQAQDTHPPLFYIFLNLICSVYQGQFSEWFGIGLNIVFLILTEAALYLLLQHYLQNRCLSVLFSMAFCCSMLSVDLVLFIRMYVLLMAITVFQTWYHLRLYEMEMRRSEEAERIRVVWPRYALLAILTIIGSLTHYYYLVWMALIAALYVILLWRERRIRAIRYYIATMIISAAVYVVMYPAVINHLFLKYRGREAVHKFIKGESLFGDVILMFRRVNEALFKGSLLWIVVVLVTITVILICSKLISRKQIVRGLVLAMPIVIYFIGISKASPYVSRRYISPVAPLIYAFIVIWAMRLIACVREQRARLALHILTVCVVLGTTFYIGTPSIKGDSYANRRDAIASIAKQATCCVYLTADDYDWKMWDDYVHYSMFEGLYFIDGRDRDPIVDEQLLAQDNLGIFVDQALDVQETIDYLKQYLPEREYDLVYETANVAYYLAH